ncbi:MAG: DUF2272 domain-containing protein [Nitrosomonas sp.]|nr:DUF2272 domain-containing protein [Nitrosomonas sp.]
MITKYVKKLTEIVEEQYNLYRYNDEDDPNLSKQIRKYWEDIGENFPGVKKAWSAVFVSWCIKKAGATKTEFKFHPRHAAFVHKAIENADKNQGVFRGHDISSYAPGLGDIIQNNRSDNSFDFDFAKKNKKYLSHSAIVIGKGTDRSGNYVMTIGGNESNTISKKRIQLLSDGLIKQRNNNPYICIIQNMK